MRVLTPSLPRVTPRTCELVFAGAMFTATTSVGLLVADCGAFPTLAGRLFAAYAFFVVPALFVVAVWRRVRYAPALGVLASLAHLPLIFAQGGPLAALVPTFVTLAAGNLAGVGVFFQRTVARRILGAHAASRRLTPRRRVTGNLCVRAADGLVPVSLADVSAGGIGIRAIAPEASAVLARYRPGDVIRLVARTPSGLKEGVFRVAWRSDSPVGSRAGLAAKDATFLWDLVAGVAA